MDKHASLLKTVLADAILLGTQLSEHGYGERIYTDSASAIRLGIERLRSSTGAFLDATAPGSVKIDDVFPLHDEIQRGSALRRNP